MESNFQYLFNSSGEWIAFRVNRFLFNTNGHWIGWLPWNDMEIVDKKGNYLGHIFPSNRLYKKYYSPYREYPGYPGYPGFTGYSPLPLGAGDIDIGIYD